MPVAWLLGPINTALLPRISYLVGANPQRAQQLARLTLLLQGVLGVALGLAIALTAPRLILIFGEEYAAAADALRVMAAVIPLMVLNGALITQWLIPHGLDRPLNRVTVASAMLNLALVLSLARPFGAVGMAWIAVAVEAVILTGLLFVVRHKL